MYVIDQLNRNTIQAQICTQFLQKITKYLYHCIEISMSDTFDN